jgi:hypothetical protein
MNAKQIAKSGINIANPAIICYTCDKDTGNGRKYL